MNERTALGPMTPPRTPYEEAVVAMWRDVLGRSDVGVFDNFFELDGHSLLALRVVAHVKKVFGVEVSVHSIFESPTVAALAASIEAAKDRSSIRPALTNRSAGYESVLSYDQQRLWLEDQLRPGAAYNVHGRRRLRGRVDIVALERSIRAILLRHEALRTRFPIVDDRPVQVVEQLDDDWRIRFEDLSQVNADQERAARILADEDARTPFDLTKGPLLRCQLIKLSESDHLLAVTMHHIVSDAWSVGLFLRELSELYKTGGDVQQADLPQLPVQYRDFAIWQREWLDGGTLDTQLRYWRDHLAGAPPAVALPTNRRRSRSQGAVGGRVRATLPLEQVEAIRSFRRKHGVTLFMTLLATLATLLRRWSGQEDLVIGAPIASRNNVETAQLIGFFVNTLPLRVDLSGDPTFAELLERVRTVALEGYAHGETPFDVLVKELQLSRDPTRTPLFQVALNMVDIAEETAQFDGVSVDFEESPVLPSKFDMMLNARERIGTLDLELAFHADRYDRETAQSFLEQCCNLLRAVVADPEGRIQDYPLQDSANLATLEEVGTQEDGDRAANGAGIDWAYAQVSGRASALAPTLAERYAGHQGSISVVQRSTADFATAVLACMEAGVPFSIVEDGEAVLTRAPQNTVTLDPDPPAGLTQEVVDVRALLHDDTDSQEPQRNPGSRGGYSSAVAESLSLDRSDRVAILGGCRGHVIFGLSAAVSGGAAALVPDNGTVGDSESLIGWLEANSVSVLYLTPAQLRALAGDGMGLELPSLRYAVIDNSGELTSQDIVALRRLSPSCRCISAFGATRTGQPIAIFATPDTWNSETAPLRIPLGRIVQGVDAELRNPVGRPCVVGEVGQIYFQGEPTGDLARLMHDGTIQIADGTDEPPAEIVAALRDLPAVTDAVVVSELSDTDDRSTRIAYVATTDPELTEATLSQHLRLHVADYLVPDRFSLVDDRLPLTCRGDYDLTVLPAPADLLEPAETYVAPRTPLEGQLTEILQTLLEVERVGVHDAFFEFGGFSLLATQLVSRIHETFHCQLSLLDVFESPTVEGLAELVVQAQAELVDPGDLAALLAEIE